MVENKYDDTQAIEELQGCPEIRVCLDESEEKMSFFEVCPAHMTKEIPAPITVTDKGHTWADLMKLFDETEFSKEISELWGRVHTQVKQSMKQPLESYLHYLQSDPKCSSDVKKMVSCIVYELQTFPEKYDAAGVLLMLAQNGGVCNVQKEFGIRSVYAGMMDSMMDHMKANSVETRILNILKKTRYVISEQVAVSIYRAKYNYPTGFVNTHYIVPVQNELSSKIGIDFIPEPNPCVMEYPGDRLSDFNALYTVDYIVKVISGALNDSHRLINYHDCVEFMEGIKPAGVDSYTFLNEFVFDMDTGKFKEHAVKYLLWKLQILKLGSVGNEHLKKLEKKRSVEINKTPKKPHRHQQKHLRHQEKKLEVQDSKIGSREEQETTSIPLGPFIGFWLLSASLLLVLSGIN
jgi:hypothetical protein